MASFNGTMARLGDVHEDAEKSIGEMCDSTTAQLGEVDGGTTAKIGEICDDTAAQITGILNITEKSGDALQQYLNGTLETTDCDEGLAKNILEGLKAIVKAGHELSGALKAAYETVLWAIYEVVDFVEEHPILCTVIVLGIMALLMPWAIKALGFAVTGPVAGIPPTSPVTRKIARLTLSHRIICSFVAV